MPHARLEDEELLTRLGPLPEYVRRDYAVHVLRLAPQSVDILRVYVHAEDGNQALRTVRWQLPPSLADTLYFKVAPWPGPMPDMGTIEALGVAHVQERVQAPSPWEEACSLPAPAAPAPTGLDAEVLAFLEVVRG